MHHRVMRSAACFCTALLLPGCGGEQPLAPDAAGVAPARGAVGGLVAPSGLATTAISPAQIALTWQDNSGGESGFEVLRSATGPDGWFGTVTITAANVGAYTDAWLAAGTRYCYRVRAFKQSGSKTSWSAPSDVSCAVAVGPPSTPYGASAHPVSSTAVAINWTDYLVVEDGFRVERAVSSAGPWELAAATDANVTSAEDGGRASEQPVCYRVIAYNAYGDSGPSNVACTAPPAGPTDLVATSTNFGAVALTWTDNSTVEDAYDVEASTDGVSFQTIVSMGPNRTGLLIDTRYVAADQLYWYRVRARKDAGFSDPSGIAAATITCQYYEFPCLDNIDNDCDGYPDGEDFECHDCGQEGCGVRASPPDAMPPGHRVVGPRGKSPTPRRMRAR